MQYRPRHNRGRLSSSKGTKMNWTRVQSDMAKQGYVAADDLAMALHIALTLGKPLLLEGTAGVGKTDIARTLARAYDTRLIRLQCYEGLDAAQAIYEWNYQRQLLAIRAAGPPDGRRRSNRYAAHTPRPAVEGD